MTTPYLESKAHRFWKRIFCLILLVVLMFVLCGCVKQQDSVETATEAAHQQIIAIKESLPKECQTKAIDEQLKAHDTTIESIKANCDLDRQRISNEKMRWKWSFFALAFIVLAHIAKKILK